MSISPASPLPAYINARAGSADEARTALGAAPGFVIHEEDPAALGDVLRRAAADGHSRVLVAGGDGTVATAAAALAGSATELAVLPGGTLNHFARDHGIPTEADEALALAANGAAAPVDVAFVNDRLFLNTSSLGAYVRFVRLRDAMEHRVGYLLASLVAGVRVLASLRSYVVTLQVEGEERTYRTPMVFIGVGERELRVPTLGGRVKDGRRGLHVLVVRGGATRRVLALAALAMLRGLHATTRMRLMDSVIVDECRIVPPRHGVAVAADGEVLELQAPLRYRLERDALRVVQPPPER